MAARRQLFDMAVCVSSECVPFGTEAVSGGECRAVLALPLRYREPLILFYFHEMDVGAAARTMRIPEGTLKARLARARTLLRNRFPHLEDEHAALDMAAREA